MRRAIDRARTSNHKNNDFSVSSCDSKRKNGMKDSRASNAQVMDRLFKKGIRGCSTRTKLETVVVNLSSNRRCGMCDIVSRTTPRVLKPLRASWNYLSFFHNWRFPLQPKIVRDESWRSSNGKRRRNRNKLTGFPTITLYDEEITTSLATLRTPENGQWGYQCRRWIRE